MSLGELGLGGAVVVVIVGWSEALGDGDIGAFESLVRFETKPLR